MIEVPPGAAEPGRSPTHHAQGLDCGAAGHVAPARISWALWACVVLSSQSSKGSMSQGGHCCPLPTQSMLGPQLPGLPELWGCRSSRRGSCSGPSGSHREDTGSSHDAQSCRLCAESCVPVLAPSLFSGKGFVEM